MPRSRSVALEGRLVGCLYKLLKKIKNFSAVIFFQFFGHQNPAFGSIMLAPDPESMNPDPKMPILAFNCVTV
jgi:hypothetical protein